MAPRGTTASIPKEPIPPIYAARSLSVKYELQRQAWFQDAKTQNPPAPKKQLLAVKKRQISNQRIEENIYRLEASTPLIRQLGQSPDLHWVPLQKLNQITLSGPHRRWIDEIRSNHA